VEELIALLESRSEAHAALEGGGLETDALRLRNNDGESEEDDADGEAEVDGDEEEDE
jgi:hypothetical protein